MPHVPLDVLEAGAVVESGRDEGLENAADEPRVEVTPRALDPAGGPCGPEEGTVEVPSVAPGPRGRVLDPLLDVGVDRNGEENLLPFSSGTRRKPRPWFCWRFCVPSICILHMRRLRLSRPFVARPVSGYRGSG
jgi:hypothetical protein